MLGDKRLLSIPDMQSSTPSVSSSSRTSSDFTKRGTKVGAYNNDVSTMAEILEAMRNRTESPDERARREECERLFENDLRKASEDADRRNNDVVVRRIQQEIRVPYENKEFHNFQSSRATPKLLLHDRLRRLGLTEMAERVEDDSYDF